MKEQTLAQKKYLPESWVVFDIGMVELWNYFSEYGGNLMNTRKLFQLAARPHFDFFLNEITHPVMLDLLDFDRCRDVSYRETLKSLNFKNRSEIDIKLSVLKNQGNLLLLTKKGFAKSVPGIFFDEIVVVDNIDPFGNPEPFWRSVRLRLNKKKFSAVLVNLGEEKVMVIPRLVQVYGKDALDVSFLCENTKKEDSGLVSKVFKLIKRKINNI